MALKIALFGITRDIVGEPTLAMPTPAPATVGALLDHLRAVYPALGQLRSCAVAVNNEYAPAGQAIGPNDEIALIPPVAGG